MNEHLVSKLSKDINSTITRATEQSPQPWLPLFIAAAATALVPLTAHLHIRSGEPDTTTAAEPVATLTAALLAARTVLSKPGQSYDSAIDNVKDDIDALYKAGRLGPPRDDDLSAQEMDTNEKIMISTILGVPVDSMHERSLAFISAIDPHIKEHSRGPRDGLIMLATAMIVYTEMGLKDDSDIIDAAKRFIDYAVMLMAQGDPNDPQP